MIPETALAIAGDHAHLVARPSGVTHVYAGPLTPSGRFAPRAARPVCRTHTRQLHVLPSLERRSSLDARAANRHRLCVRCTARLDRDRDRSRRATKTPCSRAAALELYAGTGREDVAFALNLAASPAEVDAAAWLSLLLFGVAGCRVPFTARGRTWASLHDLVCRARTRVDGYPEEVRRRAEAHDRLSLDARDQRIRDAREVRQDRERRIERLGINNAEPEPRRATHR